MNYIDKCQKCGFDTEEITNIYYKCGVKSCGYKYITNSPSLFKEKVIKCPKCNNETLILHSEKTRTCSNPNCHHISFISSSKGGSCFIATLSLPSDSIDLEVLRQYRDNNIHNPIFYYLVNKYYFLQPFLGQDQPIYITRQLIRGSAYFLRKINSTNNKMLNQHFIEFVAIILFLVGVLVHFFTVILQWLKKVLSVD